MMRIALPCLLVIAGPALAAPPAPTDFAYGMSIVTDGTAPLYELTVPRELYQTVTRADLGDVRVFNAAGESVPHALRASQAGTAPVMRANVPWYPLPAGAERTADDLSLTIERNHDGSIVNVKTGPGAKPVEQATTYVLDTTAFTSPLRALEFDWRDDGNTNVVARLRLEHSDDLQHWRALGEHQIARLTHDGRTLAQCRIEFAPVKAKYLRLSWLDPAARLDLTRIDGELVGNAVAPAREWLPATVRPGDQAGEYALELPGHMPIDRVRLVLPPGNALFDVELLAPGTPAESWRPRASGLVYRFETPNGVVTNTELALAHGTASQWRLKLRRMENAAMADGPRVEFGWVPQQLVFVAQGAGPFQLAYGSAHVAPVGYTVDQLLSPFRAQAKPVEIPRAQLQAARALTGPEALRVPTVLPWKQWLLWSVLVVGVILLGLMAWKLFRQMNDPGRQTDA